MNKFKRTGSVMNDKSHHKERPLTVATEENVQKVENLFASQPMTSIRRGTQELDLNYNTVRKILKENLQFFPYKIQVRQPLNERQIEQRLTFAKKVIYRIGRKIIDTQKIWFTDEARFELSGYVNKQNHRIWGSEKPIVGVSKPLHSESVTVWCAISGHMIIALTSPKRK